MFQRANSRWREASGRFGECSGQAAGHDVYALVVPRSPLRAELSALPRQNIVELPMRNSLNLISAFKLARFLRDHHIEIIHAHVARDYPLAAIAASRANGTQLVLTPSRAVSVTQEPPADATQRCPGLSLCREPYQTGFAPSAFLTAARLLVIHNGIDIDRIAKGSEGIADRGADADFASA